MQLSAQRDRGGGDGKIVARGDNTPGKIPADHLGGDVSYAQSPSLVGIACRCLRLRKHVPAVLAYPGKGIGSSGNDHGTQSHPVG